MVSKKFSIIWDVEAVNDFKSAYQYIKKESPRAAKKVKREIINAVKKIALHPDSHQPDKFKINNTGNYRAFEKYSYRIAYKISEKEIFILRFRHVKREPLEY
jgi:plasmid stabilization system protein ParE